VDDIPGMHVPNTLEELPEHMSRFWFTEVLIENNLVKKIAPLDVFHDQKIRRRSLVNIT
jgi:hypothetical protein